MDNPVNQVQDTIRQMWYSETNSGESDSSASLLYQMCVNLVPTFIHDTFLPYGRPREQMLMKRDGSQIVTNSGTALNWAQLTANPNATSVLDAIVITSVYDVIVVAARDEVALTYWLFQVRPVTGTVTTIGTFLPANGEQILLTEISTSSGGNLVPGVAVCQSKLDRTIGKGFYAITSGGVFTSSSLTEITDTGFPSHQTPALIPIGRFQQLNGHIFIASLDGQIWNSATNDITTWKDSNGNLMNASASFYPDQLIGLERYKNHLVAFGTNSIEFFDDVGATPGPLAVTDQATIRFGCFFPSLITNLNDQLFWVGYGTGAINGIWTLDGYTPTKISTPFIDDQIKRLLLQTNQIGVKLSGGIINSRPHLTISGIQFIFTPNVNIPVITQNDSFALNAGNIITGMACYNITDQTWWYWSDYSNFPMFTFLIRSFPTPNLSIGEVNIQYMFKMSDGGGGSNNQYLYALTPDYYKDDTSTTTFGPIVCYVQTNPLWFTNEKRKRVNRFKIIRDRYLQATGDSNIYSGYVLYFRDNDVQTNSGFYNFFSRQIPLPQNPPRYYINNLGTGRMWGFGYIEASASSLRIHAYEMDVQQNVH